jgi:hypothetical protein
MSIAFSAEPIPLCEDQNGDIRVGESRVLLDLLVRAFDDGATPETIVQMSQHSNWPRSMLPSRTTCDTSK